MPFCIVRLQFYCNYSELLKLKYALEKNLDVTITDKDTCQQRMIAQYIDEYRIDGVFDVIFQSCHTYNIETAVIRNVAQGKNTPYLAI